MKEKKLKLFRCEFPYTIVYVLAYDPSDAKKIVGKRPELILEIEQKRGIVIGFDY